MGFNYEDEDDDWDFDLDGIDDIIKKDDDSIKDDSIKDDEEDDWDFSNVDENGNIIDEPENDWVFEDDDEEAGIFTTSPLVDDDDLEDIDEATPSIVPDDIHDVSIVALSLDDIIIAYRFNTSAGKFDISKVKAYEYGLSSIKIEKMIRLERKNGLILSKSEIKAKHIVPNVSDCETDCRKLINALFE
ncbi:MAG: hypothetical protein IJ224_06420 [Lachnospiraceae bacterium]|nr:hypothetical protein [Lachnospiraceae bacterium]